MNRLRRIIFNALTALSLVLCLATAVLWSRSHTIAESMSWNRGMVYYYCFFYQGRCLLVRQVIVDPSRRERSLGFKRRSEDMKDAPEVGFDAIVEGMAYPVWHWAGFGFFRDTALRAMYYTHAFSFPAWSVIILTSAFPAARAIGRNIRRGRRRRGLCPTCNYDLRATSGRCPECGTIPAKATA